MQEWFPTSDTGKKITDGMGEEFANFYLYWLRDVAVRNVKLIFTYAESPIEKIFFNAFNFLVFMNGKVLGFREPKTLTGNMLSDAANRGKRAKSLTEWYRDVLGGEPTSIGDWARKTGDYTEDYSNFLDEIVFDTNKGVRYIILQPTFPDVIPGGGSIRGDAFIFTLDMSTKVVVECDGFKYHKEHSSFTRDRQKDRFLKAKGAYSGPCRSVIPAHADQ